jgi:hypothetical protein
MPILVHFGGFGMKNFGIFHRQDLPKWHRSGWPIFGRLFTTEKVLHKVCHRMGWATFWAFFANSSGHPAHYILKVYNMSM